MAPTSSPGRASNPVSARPPPALVGATVDVVVAGAEVAVLDVLDVVEVLVGATVELEAVGGVVVVTGAAAMVTVNRLAGELSSRSATITRTVNVPETVGVPEISPVFWCRASPSGNAPSVTDHRYGGPVPPAASSVTL